MKRSTINPFIKKHWRKLSDQELAIKCNLTVNAVEHRRHDMGLKRNALKPDPRQAVEYETTKERDRQAKAADKATTKYLISENERLQHELDAAFSLRRHVTTHKIRPRKRSRGEATMIALASDWHIEEEVRPVQVNGVNAYNLEIARERADHFFTTLLHLVEIERQNTRVDTLVLALLGDFITGNIHDDAILLLQENEALLYANDCLISGIKYLLKNSDLNIVCVCHSGNHARITKKQRHATEHQNSQEWLLYKFMASYFRDEPRLTFQIPESYHSYLQVYDWTLRFHHGHDIRYGGGVGGLTIPANKAIAQWNRLKHADFDCFGHFHQAFDGGTFISNGSMIGYNAYAISIKAAYEEPVQMLFGIHSKLGKYITRSIKFLL